MKRSHKNALYSIPGWEDFVSEDLRKYSFFAEAHKVLGRARKAGKLPSTISKNIQERKDANWISSKRVAKSGKGSSLWYPELDEIAEQYGFTGLFNPHEQMVIDRTINMCHEVLKRAQKRGRLPNENAGNGLQEVKDAKWLCHMRDKKAGKRGNWYQEFDELDKVAEQYGFLGAFDFVSFEKTAIDKAHEILRRAKDRGSLPKISSKDRQEVKDANWINHRKHAKLGRGDKRWYPELDEIAEQYGFPRAFEIKIRSIKQVFYVKDFKQEAIDKAHEVFKLAKEKGMLPKWDNKDAGWINTKKQAKSGKGSSIWYPELDEIAKQYGFPHAFNVTNFKQEAINKAHEVFKLAKEKGILPNCHSKDGSWVSTKMQAKYGKGSCVWYYEFDEIAKRYGFPNAFNKKDFKHKQVTIDKAHEVFKKTKEKGELPKKGEKYFHWIKAKKRAKYGKGKDVWHYEFDEIAKEYGFPNAFDKKG